MDVSLEGAASRWTSWSNALRGIARDSDPLKSIPACKLVLEVDLDVGSVSRAYGPMVQCPHDSDKNQWVVLPKFIQERLDLIY
eukprot:3085595-Amphidinium_carterae.2